MRIFLTGGTGYIGKTLVRRLVAAGHEVRALVRPTSVIAPLTELGVQTFVGDIADRYSMREGMSGSDWVIHAAADLDLNGPLERMRAVNVAGSDNVASLAYKLGVGRFLSVSSMAYFGGSAREVGAPPATEELAPIVPFPSSYSATKHLGERVIREWAKRGLKVNTVYPSLVYGPPGKKEGANSILRALWLGRYPVLVGGNRRTSWIFIDDVVDGILRVMERAPVGRDYLLTGEVATLRALAGRIAALGGAKAPRVDLPVAVARVVVGVASPLYRLAGRRPPFSPAQLGSLTREWAFDDTRARVELEWTPRGLEGGLPLTVEYFAAG
jgi:nucleoside-diphosphate-sugar epimerase